MPGGLDEIPIGLREFGFKLSVIAAPLCEATLGRAARECSRGRPAIFSPRRYVFSMFIACPPAPLAFKAFWAQNQALLRVWRIGVLKSSVFIDWIGPRAHLPQKSAVL